MESTLQKIKVNAKSAFGVKDETTDKWLNPSDKKLLESFKVGGIYEVELAENKGKDGKVYININSIKSSDESQVGKAPVGGVKRSFGGRAPRTPQEQKSIVIQAMAKAVLGSPVMTYAPKGQEVEYAEVLIVKLVAMVERLSK
jgi:hypothetical protein